MHDDFDWIFFDCFNTLIDDFDPAGDEFGLVSLPALAVAGGFFARQEDFVACYRRHRSHLTDPHREVPFDERLRRTLAASPRAPSPALIATQIAQMLARWEDEYLAFIRPTPGVMETIVHWAARKRLGVVSNFFLPDYPARYPRNFGLGHHFQFVLDSASFGSKKPGPAIFARALHLASLTPAQAQRVLFIGDRLELDVLPARAIGMQVIHFNRMRTRSGIAASPADIPCIYDLADLR